jgi:uracil-DNA glycosylase
MLLETIWDFIDREVFKLPPTRYPGRSIINPYHDLIPGIDLPNADRLRRENLHSYLASITEWPRYLAIGEAPGWRGCRFSGVPFTSEVQLVTGLLPFSGIQTSRRTTPYREASATIFWQVMQPYHPRFLAWNCIPFHCHQAGKPLSNRSPGSAEIDIFAPLLARLISLLAPEKVIAIGNSAQRTLSLLGLPYFEVRHPAHGGSKEFGASMARILHSLHVE